MTVYRSIDSNSCLSCTHKTFIVTLTQLSCNVDICNSINITYQSINVTNQELQKHESVYRSLHIYEILLLLQHSQTLESFVNLHKQFLVISKYFSIIFFPSTSLFLFYLKPKITLNCVQKRHCTLSAATITLSQ